jgi:hypothetical protein
VSLLWGELKAYTVYEHELDTLANGSPASVLLNLSYALIPVALTILVALLTTSVTDTVFVVFVCSFLVFLLAGIICLIVGWRSALGTRALAEQIKRRMPPLPELQQLAPESPPPSS